MSGLCVIFNPTSGRGRARDRIESLRRALGPDAAFLATNEPGHAEKLARNAALEGFAVVGAAGGDGTVHEVTNGVLRPAGGPIEGSGN